MKNDFFDDLFVQLNQMSVTQDCTNVTVVGDFNLVFKRSEMMNRLFNAQEARVAAAVRNFINQANLTSIWAKKSEFTWNRANSDCFSTIDHVFFCSDCLEMKEVRTNWALSCSDHAAVEVGFDPVGEVKSFKSRITRLDPSLLKDSTVKARILQEVQTLLEMSCEGWDPHLKLDYAKMYVRTVMEKEQADRKVKEKTEEELVNIELDLAIKSLQNNFRVSP